MNFMRAGPQLGVDASGVSGFTRLCRSASSPSQHSFCNEEYSSYLNQYLTYTFNNIHSLIRPNFYH